MDIQLVIAALSGIALLLILILRFKLQAFLSLLLASIAVGLIAGMAPLSIIDSIKNGMGGTLGFVATVVGLGALFGAILEHSGGAQSIAQNLLKYFGEERSPLALAITGFVVAIPVFLDVAFIILVPIVYALQKKTGKSLLTYGIPLLAGLAITHSFIPPTPGPIAVADILGANLGWVIFFGVICGSVSLVISGLWFGKYIGERIHVETPDYMEVEDAKPNADLPSALLIIAIIFVPILLILLNTLSGSSLGTSFGLSKGIIDGLAFVGHPFVALIIANLLAWYLLGIKRGTTKEVLSEISAKSMAPAGMIILLTGAGGVFKQILIDTGVGDSLAQSLTGMGVSPMVFAFIAAALVRVMQGSATVAMITAASMTAPILATGDFSASYIGLLVIAIAAGATILSHVNDSGFWLVNRYFGMTEKQTLQSWTVMETLIALSAFGVAMILSFFV